MTDAITFSVLLPTRDRLELAKGAIETVRRQDFADWELIVADNCSKDDVGAYVASLGDPRIRHLRSDVPLTVTENWNRAMDAASGRWVVMLGDDDGLTPGYFRRMLELVAAFADLDLLYTGAWHFAFPGAVPDLPDGRLTDETSRAEFLRPLSQPTLLDPVQAEHAARMALGMRMVYGFNMQYFLFSDRFLGRLRQFGPVYQGPFPDFYAANLSMLIADRILAVPEPRVVIGISPKSFGFYHFNDKEKSGIDFLNISRHLSDAPESLSRRLLPGTAMNTSWLVSVELVRQKLAGIKPVEIGVERYRLMQVFDVIRRGAEGLPAESSLGELWPRLDLKERALALGAWLALLPARLPIPGMRRGWLPYLRRVLGQPLPDVPPAVALPSAPRDMAGVFDALQDPSIWPRQKADRS